jgi:hypothetical protein
VETCNPANGQLIHTPIAGINDNDACTNDACNPATGNITHTPNWSQDANLCDVETCNPANGQLIHTPIAGIDDGIACTVDACDPATGNITHTPGAVEICGNGIDDDCDSQIDEGCTCTSAPTANAGGPYSSCGNKTLNGSVGGSATAGTWSTNGTGGFFPSANLLNATYMPSPTDLTNGSVTLTLTSNNPNGAPCSSAVSTAVLTFTSIDDQNACTVDACDGLTGLPTHTPLPAIDDNDPCTIDACNPTNGNITHTPKPVDDNNACTIDACDPSNGNIVHTPLPAINDENECTIDACNPTNGAITHTPKVTVSASSTPAGCTTSDGTATATPGGSGTSPYSYLWSPGGQTTQTATGLAGGNYTVTVTDSKGCTASTSVNVASSGNVTAPAAINGPIGGCRGQQGVVYCVDPVPGATSYKWTLPSGVSIVGSTSGNCITVNFSNSFSGGNLCVRAQSSCGNSSYTCMNLKRITAMPGIPLHISGPNPLCPGQTATYSIASVLWATSYEWTVTGGLILNSGQGTTSISVTAPAGFISGTISVKAKNCKGTSPSRTRTITGLPETPVWDFEKCGDNSIVVCGGMTYKYEVHFNPKVTCYLWTAPQGAVIHDQSGNSGNPLLIPTGHNDDVTITFPQGFTSGVVTVQACNSNSCGQSAVATLNVSSTPAQPGPISGPSPVCKNSTRSFSVSSVPGATYYNWSVTGGATIRSGQGTRNVTVRFNSVNTSSVDLSVKAKKDCDYSQLRTRTINVNVQCRVVEGIEMEEELIISDELTSVNAYPNPTSGKTLLTFNSTIETKYVISVVDMLGKVMLTESIHAINGYNEKEIDLSGMSTGIYLFNLQAEGRESQRIRVVVE